MGEHSFDSSSLLADIMAHQAGSRTAITTLPTDVLSCIVRRIQENALQHDQRLDDVAALRSTCCSVRNTVDASVTSATFNPNVEVDELRSTVRRCDGGCTWSMTSFPDVLQVRREGCTFACMSHSQLQISDGRLQEQAKPLMIAKLQACRPSSCSSCIPTPLLQPWRRLRLCQACAPLTCRKHSVHTCTSAHA